jgi:hypothetical protein
MRFNPAQQYGRCVSGSLGVLDCKAHQQGWSMISSPPHFVKQRTITSIWNQIVTSTNATCMAMAKWS